jgi:hypothetical protein
MDAFNLDIVKVGGEMKRRPRQSYTKEYRGQAAKRVTQEQLMTKIGDARKPITDKMGIGRSPDGARHLKKPPRALKAFLLGSRAHEAFTTPV